MTYDPVVNLGRGLAARRREGPGEGVLWVHPYALDSTCWTELWERLPHWSHLGIDLPGHGLSLPAARDEDAATLARRLGDTALEHGARHIVGLSFGALLAMQIAAERPQAFASLVLGSPIVGHGANDDPFWKRIRELFSMYRMAGHGEQLRGRLMLVEPTVFEGAAGHPPLWDRLFAIVGRHSFQDLQDLSVLRIGEYAPSDVMLHDVQGAALLIVGDREATPGKREAERLAHVMRGSRRLDMLGVGRLSLLEAPAAAATAIESHLQAHSRHAVTTAAKRGHA